MTSHTSTPSSFDFDAYTFPLIKHEWQIQFWRFIELIKHPLWATGACLIGFNLMRLMNAYELGLIQQFGDLYTFFSNIAWLLTGVILTIMAFNEFIRRLMYTPNVNYQRIGSVQINPDRISIQSQQDEPEIIPFAQIHRINVYWYHGKNIAHDKHGTDMEVFTDILSMRLRIRLRDNSVREILVQNNQQDEAQSGALFELIRALRKTNTQYHQRVQFWAKY